MKNWEIGLIQSSRQKERIHCFCICKIPVFMTTLYYKKYSKHKIFATARIYYQLNTAPYLNSASAYCSFSTILFPLCSICSKTLVRICLLGDIQYTSFLLTAHRAILVLKSLGKASVCTVNVLCNFRFRQ